MLFCLVPVDLIEMISKGNQAAGKALNGSWLVSLALLLSVFPYLLWLFHIFSQSHSFFMKDFILLVSLSFFLLDLNETLLTCCLSVSSYSVVALMFFLTAYILTLSSLWLRCLWPWVKNALMVRVSINLIIIQIKIPTHFGKKLNEDIKKNEKILHPLIIFLLIQQIPVASHICYLHMFFSFF